MIHDLQSEVAGDYGKALFILAEVLCVKLKEGCATVVHSQQMRIRPKALNLLHSDSSEHSYPI